MVYMEVTLHGPSHDLHSGMYGGAVVNPAQRAHPRARSSSTTTNGVVQVPGFYDDVRELSEKEAGEWAALGFDEKAFLASAGLAHTVGEQGRSVLERTWSRPTCDVNGMWGGYTGAGAKTVIPAHASAKVSCRLVADQDPQKVYDGIVAFLNERTPRVAGGRSSRTASARRSACRRNRHNSPPCSRASSTGTAARPF